IMIIMQWSMGLAIFIIASSAILSLMAVPMWPSGMMATVSPAFIIIIWPPMAPIESDFIVSSANAGMATATRSAAAPRMVVARICLSPVVGGTAFWRHGIA